jgi:acetoin utilization deacetylase AcuC-like enzyme
MKVVRSGEHRRHDPPYEVQFGHQVPVNERPERVDAIERALAAAPGTIFVEPTSHGDGPLVAVHDPDLVVHLATVWRDWFAATGERVAIPETFPSASLRDGMGAGRRPTDAVGRLSSWAFDTSTPLVEGTYEAARAAVDVALTATDLVLAGERCAYGLCRPPGHHAPKAAYGGFCFFNNAAIAAQHALDAGARRVTVLDVDYHHGNGTQQIFYGRSEVQFVSLHGDPDRAYPYFTGFDDETGTGPGRGATLNLPLAAGCTDDEYLGVLAQALDAVAAFGPELLVVSLGVDTHGLDPLSDLAVTADAFAPCGRAVGRLAIPTVLVQEGGYHLPSLGATVTAFLTGVAAGLS